LKLQTFAKALRTVAVANAKHLANPLAKQAVALLTKHAKTTKENNLSIAKLGLPKKLLAVPFY
jgi:hypothetical protein